MIDVRIADTLLEKLSEVQRELMFIKSEERKKTKKKDMSQLDIIGDSLTEMMEIIASLSDYKQSENAE